METTQTISVETQPTQRQPKDYKSDLEPIWCPGCGDYGVLNALFKAMSQLNLDPDKTVLVSGIGCSSRLPGFVVTYGFHGVHGRVLPVATGIKLANPELTVIGVGGDGDGYSIGLGHFPHAARRNIDITYIVMNNQIYGLTKGQTSPTSSPQFVTKTTPFGNVESSLNPLQLAIVSGATFVARGYSSMPNHLARIIAEAIRHPGFALVDVFSPCVTFNKVQTYDYYKGRVYEIPDTHDPTDKFSALRLAEEDGMFPVGIFYRVDRPTLDEQIAMIKRQAYTENPSVEQLFRRYQ
ncbi:MAG: 2-oxoacid ferredoxin oxidoreductase [Armatimonadota bacterium]